MGKKHLEGSEGHLEVRCVGAVTMVVGLFSRTLKLEPKTDM